MKRIGAGVNTLMDVYLYLYLRKMMKRGVAGVNTLMDVGVRQTPLVTHD